MIGGPPGEFAENRSSDNAQAMPIGVGARARAIRAVVAMGVVAAGLAVLATPAQAQVPPAGGQINIVKQVEGGGDVTAFFTVFGDPDIFNRQATTVGGPARRRAAASRSAVRLVRGSRGRHRRSVSELTSIECDDPDADIDLQGQQAIISLTPQAPSSRARSRTRSPARPFSARRSSRATRARGRDPRSSTSLAPSSSSTSTSSRRSAPAARAPTRSGRASSPRRHARSARPTPGSDAPVIVSSFVTNHGILIAAGGNCGDVHSRTWVPTSC